MPALAKVPIRMTVAEFLKWDSEDDVRYQLVDGEPRAIISRTGQNGVKALVLTLGGCQFKVEVSNDRPAREQ